MERKRYEDGRRIGSVKTAVNIYGEMILDGNSSLKKPQEDSPEPSSRVKQLHRARRDKNRYKESRKTAESELFSSRGTDRDLASMVEESNFMAKSRMSDIESLRKNGYLENKALDVENRSLESYQYEEVMRELQVVKKELSQLKLDMASVLAEKARVKKEFEDSSFTMLSNASSAEALSKQIEAANEEHVLVELAQIEALKEVGEIEAQREKEAGEFSFRMEETKKKMKDVTEEIDQSKELETKLGVTLSNINHLQDELKQVMGQEEVVQKADDGLKQQDDSFRSAEEVEPSVSLELITKELEAAKKELALIKDESFQYMSSMDIIRNELKHVTEETARLKKTEEKADLKVQSLNSKLVRAKSKLEAVATTEEKAKSTVASLSLTLEQLRAEAEASKKEKMLVTEDTATIKAEIQKTESEIDLTDEKLQAAMQELEAVKSSEALALEKLRSLIEATMQSRASASNHSSTVTISRFEYEYLTGHAVGAEEIADKKVAAAQAWIEALKASEREILMKTDLAHRELRVLRVEEEHGVSLPANKNVDSQNRQSLLLRSMKSNGSSTPSRRAKHHKSTSPAISEGGSTEFMIKKKRKAAPNLSTFFNGKKVEKDE
ncbi:hypothetical protein ES288_A07G206800v1 [Gossypium darwinii]|uniref:Uncharacterized protein n=1 Tax=Gossypium darwinii TaxID=34276 RepID=A0A5D2FYI9_GOSDA|nr:hypothetical protein ES288_A07G206800v1 [Gossypium darwinii]